MADTEELLSAQDLIARHEMMEVASMLWRKEFGAAEGHPRGI